MKEYIVYKCAECGTEFIFPKQYVNYNDNYITCPKHGRHTKVRVVGAYDDLCECMKARKYRRNERGALEQDGR